MKFRWIINADLCVGLFLCSLVCEAFAQTASNPKLLASTDNAGVTIRTVRALPQKDGPAIEIISDHSLVPTINKIDNPPRLVIDLPNARLYGTTRRLDFHSSEVSNVRLSQFRDNPPVARIVIDLSQPVSYTWDAAGNLLTVRLRSAQQTTAVPSTPAFTRGTQPAAVPVTSSSSGAVLLAGSRVPAGSSVSAGADTAVLRLGRGGEIRVCPQTTVSVTASQNGKSLMLGMSTGGLEAHYTLDASSDSILTPDFRILLAGPGEFHYGIHANSRGDTCVQALPGNTASVIVSELLGDGTYQVKPTEQVSFHAGRLVGADSVITQSCGCPAPMPSLLSASASAAPVSTQAPPSSVQLNQSNSGPRTASSDSGLASGSSTPVAMSNGPETAPVPASKPNDVHVQVEAPFVFRASDPAAAQPASAPAQAAPTREAELLPVRGLPEPARLQTAALPPPQAKTAHHGFFGKIKGFFSAIFG